MPGASMLLAQLSTSLVVSIVSSFDTWELGFSVNGLWGAGLWWSGFWGAASMLDSRTDATYLVGAFRYGSSSSPVLNKNPTDCTFWGRCSDPLLDDALRGDFPRICGLVTDGVAWVLIFPESVCVVSSLDAEPCVPFNDGGCTGRAFFFED